MNDFKYYRTLARIDPNREGDCLRICFPAWNSAKYFLVDMDDIPDEILGIWAESNWATRVAVHAKLGAETEEEFDIDHGTWEMFGTHQP